METRSPFVSSGSVNSRCKSTPLGLRTLFANRFAPTDFSIVSGRRNARPGRTPYGMLIRAVQILFLRDLNSSNEKTITRTLGRVDACRATRLILPSPAPTLPTFFPHSLLVFHEGYYHLSRISCSHGYVLGVEDEISICCVLDSLKNFSQPGHSKLVSQ